MKTYSILINQTGLDHIASALREHHKQGDAITDDMISAYASDAENSYTHGYDVTFEIGSSESLTGHPVVISVARDWYDPHEYDEFEDEDRVVELLEEIKAGLEIESMEWSPELVGFICTLEDGRVVQVQFEKNTNALDAGCGDYYPVLDTQNEYGLDLSEIEREVFMDLIRDDETVQEKAKEL